MSAELRALVRQTVSDYPEADPREIARHVAKLTPDDQLRAFYREALADLCGHMIGENRRQSFESGKQRNVSRKVNQRRSWWSDVLASMIHVGSSHWKPLRDCTSKDIVFAIDERAQQIAGIGAQIKNFQHLLKLLKQNKVDTVGQLPVQTGWPK